MNSPVIEMKKTSDWSVVSVGDTIIYKILVSNSGNTDAFDFVVRDLLAPELVFEKGSVTVDGKPVDGNIINGISIETLPKGTSKEVSFKAKVIERPEEGIIENFSEGAYCYELNPEVPLQRTQVKSNINEVIVEDVKVILLKESEVKDATIGSEFMYKVTISLSLIHI